MSVSYLKAICAQSWGHIEAFEDLRTAKNKLTATLFLIHNQMNHPVIKEVFVGAGHNPTLLHIPDVPFKHPGDKSHREANL